MSEIKTLTAQITNDGSFTFFSAEFGETYHSHYGARQEAEQKFVETTQLKHKAHQETLRLLDICYGLGYNTASALGQIWAINPNCHIEWIGLESDITVAQAAIEQELLKDWPANVRQLLKTIASDRIVETKNFHGQLLIGDARQTIKEIINKEFQADAIFLDPFSPANCPQLWTVEFLQLVAKCLKPEGYLATYSCAASIRSALKIAGLKIGSTTPVGRRSPGTVASFQGTALPDLSIQEEEHLLTKAAIPYRDPNLCDRAEIIINRRKIEQKSSSLEPSSHWKKRWFSNS